MQDQRGQGLNTRGAPSVLGRWLAVGSCLGFKFQDAGQGQSCSWVSFIGPKSYGLSGGPTIEI
jgi:hypothetical protein